MTRFFITYTIAPDGTVTEAFHKGHVSLEFLQAQVGGYIEQVPGVTRGFGRMRGTLWMNEEGLLKRLPLNPRASELLKNEYASRGWPLPEYPLVGPACFQFRVTEEEATGHV